VELKQQQAKWKQLAELAFNRTIVELKPAGVLSSTTAATPLIEP